MKFSLLTVYRINTSLAEKRIKKGTIQEKGLGVHDAVLALEYANDKAKAEKDLQFLTSRGRALRNEETILENKIEALKTEEQELLSTRSSLPKEDFSKKRLINRRYLGE